MAGATGQICIIDGCGSVARKRSMCWSHYNRWRKYKDPFGGGKTRGGGPRVCAIESCGKPDHAQGWCSAHYARWRKYGDPLGAGSVPHNPLPDVCAIEGCSRKPHAREWCITHYRRWRLYGDPLRCAPLKPQVAKSVVRCDEGGCEVAAKGRRKYGMRLCEEHRRLRDIASAEERAIRVGRSRAQRAPTCAPHFKQLPKPRELAECNVYGCARSARGHGMCDMHHGRWKRHGDPLVSKRSVEPALRFINEVALPFAGEECLIWPFTRSDEGRPNIRLNRRRVSAARYICTLAHGDPEDPKLESAHRCGNGHLGCVNPRHLRWATRKENVADAIEHGVFPLGKRMPVARMRETVVRQIMDAKGSASAREIASRFGVPARSVRDVWSGRKWSWLFSGVRRAA